MSKSTKGLRATIIRIKRTIEDVESESSEEPADSLILEIPKKKPRHFKDLSLDDKGEEEEEESQSKTKEEDGLERRVFKFVGSSREGDVENPLSLEDFMKVRTELRKTMKARAAEEASKDEQAKKRTKQDGDRPVNARVSFVSEKKSVRVLDLTEGGSSSRETKGSDTAEVVTCNGVPMKVTKKKKTVYDLYYCYERVKTKKKASLRKTEDDDDDDDDEEDDDVEYEEAVDGYDKMDSFYETIDGEAKRFRIDDYDGDIFFRNFDDLADEEEDLKNDYDYDSNAEDNSSNTYPDEDDFDSDSDGDPFGHSDNDDDDDDESKDEDDDYDSYVKWNKSTRKTKSSKMKKNLADEISMILGGYMNRKSNTMDLSDDDDDDDVMYFDGDDDKEQYFKYAYDEDYDNDDDDDSYF